MLKILNRSWKSVGTIFGRLDSGNLNNDSTQQLRRTATITLKYDANLETYRILANLSVNYYINIKLGIEDNINTEVAWYNHGIYIINQNGIKIDASSRTIELSLTDLMYDLTGDRCGSLHAYTSVVKNSQRIDTVMKNVLKLAGVEVYDIEPIRMLKDSSDFYSGSDTDYMIPYDMNFQVGVSAADILNKCVGLYPYYEAYFDNEGTYICHKKVLEKYDNSLSLIGAEDMQNFAISEDTTIEWSKVKNWIEVWGKDGNYYGEAKEENPDSPFCVAATRTMRKVISGADEETGVDSNNIYDRYDDAAEYYQDLKVKDEAEEAIATIEKIKVADRTDEEKRLLATKKQQLYLAKQKVSRHLVARGDDLAKEWAEEVLFKTCRTYDTLSLTTILLPFITETGFKLSYRSKSDNKIMQYIVQAYSHDIQGNTTTLTLRRFYSDQLYSLMEQLDTPVIKTISLDNMSITVQVDEVRYAEKYILCIDGKAVASSTGTTLYYTLAEKYAGTHKVTVYVQADSFRDSTASDNVTVEFKAEPEPVPTETSSILTSDGKILTTADNRHIVINRGE